jgi:peptidyl-prolyl cis-trans isomerase D
MATLEKIRSKGVLLIIVIGIALFAFIIGDFLNSSGTFFGQSQMNVIEVNDEKIKIDQYQEKIDELNKVYQIQMNQSQLSEEAMEQIRQSVYDNIIREQIISSCAEKTGINVSSKELFDLVSGENIHPYIQSIRMFQNPNTGGFDKSYLLNFLNTINKKDLSAEEMEQIKDAKSYWMFWENLIKNTRLEEKYTTLLSKSLNTNSLEAKFSFENGKKTVDLVYITEPYSNIADSTINISKKELKTLYKKKRKKQTRIHS